MGGSLEPEAGKVLGTEVTHPGYHGCQPLGVGAHSDDYQKQGALEEVEHSSNYRELLTVNMF